MKPLISVKIPTYNCAKYLKETIESVVNQKEFNLSLLDIEVVDDCSTNDNPEEIVKQFGRGKVKFYRHPKNVGAIKNFNTCIERSNCRYLHILHGDDFVSENFYDTILKEIENFDVVICRSFVINETSIIQEVSPQLENIKTASDLYYSNPIRTPGVFADLSVYKKIGFFDESLVHVADWDMWIRMMENFKVNFIQNPNNYYRMFLNNDTSRLVKTGGNIEDQIRLCEILSKRLDFDKIRFLKMCRNLAWNQAQSFDEPDFRNANYNYFKLLNRLIYGNFIGWLYPVYRKFKRRNF